MNSGKPFDISKYAVFEAYRRVKANKGSEGIDDDSIEDFEENLEDNLYKIWNRMSSGTYFPPPVKAVDIPKDNQEVRRLGVPTVSDRIAQSVVKAYLEPVLEPIFHKDSYGYRPGRSTIEAIGIVRERCWKYDWVLDIDIQGFFDNMDHDLVMKAVKHHTQEKWILLYVERWLKAPMILKDGTEVKRGKGTPQGGVISPLMSNLFMHYAFDKWMDRNFPNCPFVRYADDVVIHCKTEEQANSLLEALSMRLKECKLELHPKKTKIVYCKDDRRPGDYPNKKFDFLGYTFKPRKVKARNGKIFWGFNPAMSDKKRKAKNAEMRSWKIHLWSSRTLEELAKFVNPILRGWINHYGRFYKSILFDLLRKFNYTLIKWAMRKFKRLRYKRKKVRKWLGRIAKQQPTLFAHWKVGAQPTG